ncbi:MAG: ROK family protein [Anaeroplasmataceae bacterium]|nr:ROK family protein [Anaeroplasmataceae bacterium]
MKLFGIDIGGTSIKIGFFEEDGSLIEQWQIPTHPQYLLEELTQSIKTYLSKNEISFDEIYGYGLGIPGIVKDGIALSCVNLGWVQTDIKKEFRRALGYEANVYVFNDANIAAFGEASYLKEKPSTVVFVTLGTGVGGGIILNHEILEGTEGICGEIGHMFIDDKYKFKCGCGNVGCLETIASATGIVRLAFYYKDKLPSSLVFHNSLTAKEVIDAAKKEDPLAIHVVDEACLALGRALSSIAVLLNPDAFIIGGGLSNAGSFLLQKIKENYQKTCIQQAKNINLKLAGLKNNAGIYGACAYLIKKKHEVEKNGKC